MRRSNGESLEIRGGGWEGAVQCDLFTGSCCMKKPANQLSPIETDEEREGAFLLSAISCIIIFHQTHRKQLFCSALNYPLWLSSRVFEHKREMNADLQKTSISRDVHKQACEKKQNRFVGDSNEHLIFSTFFSSFYKKKKHFKNNSVLGGENVMNCYSGKARTLNNYELVK